MKGVLLLLGVGMVFVSPVRGQGAPEEKPKTAVVNIQTLFRAYYKTLEAQSLINVERAKIQKEDNDVQQRLAILDQRLLALTQRLQKKDLPEVEGKAVSREAGLLFQERESLEHSRKLGTDTRHRDLNQKMMARMDGILGEIRGIIGENAERAGFDFVFDVEGMNTTQVPFLLFAKDATDITPMVLKELNKNAPAH